MNYKIAIIALALSLASWVESEEVIEEVIVMGEFIPDEKRDTSEISDVLDTEALELLADSTVGDALARVTGLSLVGGKYVYVRGLGERYSSTLINGYRISSPVPFQKTVPLDIVPKSVVRNLLIQKTYSSEYPGDFSGGVVDIRTLPSPDDNYFEIEITAGGDSETTDGDGLTYRGGDAAWDNFGYDDGTREIPENIQLLSSEAFEDVGYPDDRGLGASFFNFWDIKEKTMKPNMGVEGELGLRFDLENDSRIGFLAAASYKNDYNNQFKDFRRYEFTGVDGGSNQTVQFDQNTTKQTINMSGFFSVGWENFDNSVSLSHIILRQTDDTLQEQRGQSSEDDVNSGTEVASYRLQWTENEIVSTSLQGEHFFDFGDSLEGASVRWRLVDGSAERISPDRRTYSYAVNREGLEEVVIPSQQAAGDLREIFQAPDRNFAELDDEIEEFGIDLELPFYVNDADFIIKLGWSEYERIRESQDRLFRFDVRPAAPDYVTLMTPSQLFSLDNWGSGFLDVRDFSASAANASGIFPFARSGEETTSAYISIDSQLHPRVRLQIGARQEETRLFADAWGGNTEQGTANSRSEDFDDTLFGGSLTWEFIDDMQVRLAYSETVNRPSLLEITGTTIRNPEDSNLYRGNVFLRPADVESVDARWEWYFGANDSFSIGVFSKEFSDPIEIGKVQAQNDIYTWFNAEEAELEGVELEFKKDLFLSDWFGWANAWNYFTLTTNLSLIDSEVTLLGSGETARNVPVTGNRQIAALFKNKRELTGQSDVLGNIIISYVDLSTGIEGSLAYNYTGERVVLVGAENAPNIIEDARGKLDLLLKYQFKLFQTDLTLEVKVKNILDEETKWTQGGLLYEQYKDGVSYSATLKAALF